MDVIMFAELLPEDFVCAALMNLPHLLISLFCVLGSSNFLEDSEE
jgi:hypothetical protein